MKLSGYAKRLGISYKTAWRYFQQGKLDAYQTHTGTIIVREDMQPSERKVAIYCRVSSSENKSNLESQKNRLLDYCVAKGYKVYKVVTEVGSGINDNRKQWLLLLKDKSINLIVVEHKDRFTRFGFNAYKVLQCSVCSYVDKNNRQRQEVFRCRFCSTVIHADVNGARKHLIRSSDEVIDIYKSKKAVLRILVDRFLQELSDTERRYAMPHSKAMALLSGNPYFRGSLAQAKGFL